jgi:parallel beta-helix repeat protein
MIVAGPGAVIEGCRIDSCNAETGINLAQGSSTVRNCTVSNSTFSVAAIFAEFPCSISGVTVQASTALWAIFAGRGSTISECAISKTTGILGGGIFAGVGSSLKNCTVSQGTYDSAAIYALEGSTLTNCAAESNDVPFGFFARSSSLLNCSAYANKSAAAVSGGFDVDYCTLTNCTAYGNTSTTADAGPNAGYGFAADSGYFHGCNAQYNRGHGFGLADSMASNCVAQNNGAASGGHGMFGGFGVTIRDSTIGTNKDFGIYLADGGAVLNTTVRGTTGAGVGIRVANRATVSGCTVNDNLGDGIQFIDRCVISNNNVSNNGTEPLGDGIRSFGNNNRIDGNTVQFNKNVGIRWSATDIVVRNFARDNPGNYIPSTGPGLGPTGAPPQSATSPWANF